MLEFLIVPFTNALVFIYNLVGNNFGIAIIIFTIVVRLVTYPFTVQQMKSARSTQELQNNPKWKEIQRKYKDNKEKLAQEQMKLYQELGINPLGACLPLLLQFPLLIAMYWAIQRALAATPLQLLDFSRGLFLPNAAELIPLNSRFLWMDLGQPERLHLDFLPFAIPVLTILVVVTSYYQSKMMAPSSSNPNDQSAQMARSMNLTMPLMMGYFSLLFSAGLALYFLTGNVFSIAQYYLMGRHKQQPGPAAANAPKQN
ncbi:MAG: YidC/Oxa1 family membrane protein insertase [Anaerolineales bacterium]